MKLLKRSVYHELVKKIDTISPNKQNLGKNIEDVDIKTPCTNKLIETHKLNKLIKKNFNARITEVSKIVSIEKQVDNALNLGDKNRGKVKNFKC